MDNALLPPSRITESTTKKENLRSLVLYGLGGVGKTSAATEYALARKPTFGGIFIIDASSIQSLERDFRRLSVALGLETTEVQSDPIASRDVVLSWLAHPVNPSSTAEPHQASSEIVDWLLVFDNADQLDVLRDFWPTDGQESVLVTCRDVSAKDPFMSISRNSRHKVQPLPVEDAAKFLRQQVGVPDNDYTRQDSVNIARRLDGIPFAITQLASIIRQERLYLSNFLNEYQTPEQRSRFHELGIHAHDNSRNSKRYEHTIASVWALDKLTQESFILLAIIALLAPNRIEPHIFLSDSVGGTLLHVDIPGYPKNQSDYDDAKNELLKASLVSHVRTPDQQRRFQVHRLVQDVTILHAQRTSDFPNIFSNVVKMVSRMWPHIFTSDDGMVGRAHHVGRWKDCKAAFPHIVHLHHQYRSVSWDQSITPEALKEFARLLLEAGW